MAYHELIIIKASSIQSWIFDLGRVTSSWVRQKLTAYNDPPVIVFELVRLGAHMWIIVFTKHLANSMVGLIHRSSDRRSPEKSSKTIKRPSEWAIQHQTHHRGPTNTSIQKRESWHVASVQNPERIRGHRLLKILHNFPENVANTITGGSL